MRIFTKSFFICIISGLLASTFAASLDGVVSDAESGNAIPDALVWAYQVNSNSTADSVFYEAVTAENGHYYFDFLPGGLFKVTVHHPDYYESSARIESSNGEIALTQDFELKPRTHYYENSVSGMISDCVTGNPLFGVYVVLYTTSGDPNIITAISNREGKYHFKNILPAAYNLIAFKEGYKTFELDRLLEIRENTHITDLDFVMLHQPNDALGWLKGYVFADDGLIHIADSISHIKDGYITPPPVYPARVELFRVTDDNATYYHSTWTNPDGSYRIRGISPGDFQVVVRARGYIAHREFITITSDYNERIFYLKPQLNRYGTIAGKVFFDESQEPVAGALINFINLTDRAYFRHTFTNDNGEYKARIKPGRYVLACSYMGYNILDTLTVSDTLRMFNTNRCGYYREYYDNAHSFADAERIAVYSGSEITDINFGLPDYLGIEKFSVSGTVLSEDGAAVAGAEVRIYVTSCFNSFSTAANDAHIHDRYYTTKTNDDGTYFITIEKKFWYAPFIIVSAQKEGFRSQFYDHKEAFYEADRIRVDRQVITSIDFDLVAEPQTDFTMAGKITNPQNNPIAGAFIITGNINNGRLYFTFSNNDGFYTFNGLPAGIYYTLFIAFGYGPELWDDATCWADADPIYLNQDIYDINAELQPIQSPGGDGMITGRIINHKGMHVSGVMVTARNLNDDIVAYAFTNAQGDYNLAGLAGGEYTVEAGRAAYQALETSVFVTEGAYATVVADILIEGNNVTAIENEIQNSIPRELFLGNNYPNPFNPSTKVSFGLYNPGRVQLSVYNIIGQRINVLIDSYLSAGNYTVEWDGQDAAGRSVSSGLYLLILETGRQRLTQKMILAK